MATNKCIYCGNPLPEQATFCTQCGRPLYPNNQPQQPVQQQPTQQQPIQQQPQQQYQQPVQQQQYPQQPAQQQYQQPQPGQQQFQQPNQQQYQQPAQQQYPPQGQQPVGQYPPQGQYQPQGQYPPPTDPGNKGGNNKLWIIALLAALLVAAAAVGGWWYWKNSQQEEAGAEPTDSVTSVIDSAEVSIDSTALEPTMKAPQIGTDMSGFHSVDDSPITYEGLDVQLKKSEGQVKSANIYKDGELLQTFNLSSGDGINYYDDAPLVHFLDANFDGYVDMVIGLGAARNFSGIFLWNPEKKQFIRATDNDDPTINADLIFAPKEKVVYASYSEGGGMSQTARMEWDGKNMKTVEWFLQMESWRYHEFSELNISRHYNVVNRNKNRIIFSTDDPKAVPARWRAWVFDEYANEGGGIEDDGREPGEE